MNAAKSKQSYSDLQRSDGESVTLSASDEEVQENDESVQETSRLEAAIIKVTNIPDETSKDALLFFFENRRKSGGGSVEDLEYDPDTKSAVITFEDPEAVKRVIGKLPIHFNGIQIGVEEFRPDVRVDDFSEEAGEDSENILEVGGVSSRIDIPKEKANCLICMDYATEPKQLQKCGHIFCKECIDASFQYKPACPICGRIYGKVTGDQPPGSITMRKSFMKLEGFNDSSGSIILTYMFDDGIQGEEHSDPGKRYKGITRSGYVPNNEKGRLIAKLLNVAFSRRLVFTIGRSRTTGKDGVITWNDIHHKTRPDGGAAKFGYPDYTYLDRVLEELDAKGVTKELADDPEEYKEYSKLFRQ